MRKVISVKDGEVIITDSETGSTVTQKFVSNFTNNLTLELYVDTLWGTKRLSSTEWKETYIEAGNQLGCSVSKFTHMVNGALYRAYIKDNIEFHNRFSSIRVKGKRSFSKELVEKVNSNAELMHQSVNDNIGHIAGFILIFGSPKKCKHILGKGLWKKLSHNSKSRNDLIVNHVVRSTISMHYDYINNNPDKFILFLNSVRYTLLNKLSFHDMAFIFLMCNRLGIDGIFDRLVKYLDTPLYKIHYESITSILNMLLDTHQLFTELGETVNPNWSIKRFNREHDVAIVRHRLMKDKMSNEKFKYPDSIPSTISSDGFTAVLADTENILGKLGDSEHNCILSYTARCRKLEYIVFEISGSNIKSTLGFNISNNRSASMEHVYKFNKVVDDTDRINFANKVISTVRGLID